MCPKTQGFFQCHKTITEESDVSLTQRGINLAFGPSLSVSRVSNDDPLVVEVRVSQQDQFK